jgi:hypothetical protein
LTLLIEALEACATGDPNVVGFLERQAVSIQMRGFARV